jgi:tRNA-2-methylthio-N6-dimethylallyladenosine synthase
VQSGSDRLLKRMLRRYSADEYRERVAALREAVPGVTLSTDIIVGFPGETREDFSATLALVRDIGFTGLFGFKYSPRPYTPALKLEDDISEDEKSRRLEELFRLSDQQRRQHLESLLGSEQSVLIEGRSRGGELTGRSERNEIVHFAGEHDNYGEVMPVRITRAYKNSLFGEAARALVPRPKAAEGQRRILPVLS